MNKKKVIFFSTSIATTIMIISAYIGRGFDLNYILFAASLGFIFGMGIGYMVWRIIYYRSLEKLLESAIKNSHKKTSEFDEIDLLIIISSIIIFGVFINIMWKGNIIVNIIGLYLGWLVGRAIIKIRKGKKLK